jgi:hypothetical protein
VLSAAPLLGVGAVMTPNSSPRLHGRRRMKESSLRLVIIVTLVVAALVWLLHEQLRSKPSSAASSQSTFTHRPSSVIGLKHLHEQYQPTDERSQHRNNNNNNMNIHTPTSTHGTRVGSTTMNNSSILDSTMEGEPRSIMIIAECLPYSTSYRWNPMAQAAPGHVVDYQLLSLIDSLIALGHRVVFAAEDASCQPDSFASAIPSSSDNDNDINSPHPTTTTTTTATDLDIDNEPVTLPHTSIVAASSVLPATLAKTPSRTGMTASTMAATNTDVLIESAGAIRSSAIAALRARGVAVLAPLQGSVSSLIHFATGHRVDVTIVMSGWCWDVHGWGAIWNTFIYNTQLHRYIPALRSYAPLSSIVALTGFCPMHTTVEELPHQWWHSVIDVYGEADHIWVPSSSDYDRLVNSVEGLNDKLQLIPFASLEASPLLASSSPSTNITDGITGEDDAAASLSAHHVDTIRAAHASHNGLLLMYPINPNNNDDAIAEQSTFTTDDERLRLFIEYVCSLVSKTNEPLSITILVPVDRTLSWINELPSMKTKAWHGWSDSHSMLFSLLIANDLSFLHRTSYYRHSYQREHSCIHGSSFFFAVLSSIHL